MKETDVQNSLKELKVLREWFDKTVMRPDPGCGTSSILILPVGPGQPIYRDIFVPPKERIGLDALSLGAWLQLPQLVIPGEISICLLRYTIVLIH